MRGLSLVVASGGHSSSRCAGLSLLRPLFLRSTGSRCAGSVVVTHGPSCSAACGIFPDQGSNPCPLHWQADSQPLRHQGSPNKCFDLTPELQGISLCASLSSHKSSLLKDKSDPVSSCSKPSLVSSPKSPQWPKNPPPPLDLAVGHFSGTQFSGLTAHRPLTPSQPSQPPGALRALNSLPGQSLFLSVPL